MADIEDDAALARLRDRRMHLSVGCRGRIRKWPEAMGEDVARPHAGEHLRQCRRRHIDMHHHRQADLVGDLAGDVERHEPGIPGRVEADPHLDADERIPIGEGDLHGIEGSHEFRSPLSPTMIRFEKP